MNNNEQKKLMNNNNTVFVGNLSWSTTNESLGQAFSEKGIELFQGTDKPVNIVTDRYTGKSRGYAFVQLANEEQVSKAIDIMNGTVVDGREIRVQKKEQRDKKTYTYNRNDNKSKHSNGGGHNRNNGGNRGRDGNNGHYSNRNYYR